MRGCHTLKASFPAVLQQLYLSRTTRDPTKIFFHRFTLLIRKKNKGCYTFHGHWMETNIFSFFFFYNDKQIRLPCLQAALQTDCSSEFFPLLPVEQGPDSPTTMPQTHRMTSEKSLNSLPGFPHPPAGRGNSDSCQEPEFSPKAVPALHLSPGFPPPNPRVTPRQSWISSWCL